MTDVAKTAALGTVRETLRPGTGWSLTNGIAWKIVSLYKQLEPFADVAGLAIGDPAGQRFSSTE